MTLSCVAKSLPRQSVYASRQHCSRIPTEPNLTGVRCDFLPIRAAASGFRAWTPLSAASSLNPGPPAVLGAPSTPQPLSPSPTTAHAVARSLSPSSRLRRLETGRYTLPRHSQRPFSTSSHKMAAAKIDGTAIAKKIREDLHAEIAERQKANPRYKPSLKIIQGVYSLNYDQRVEKPLY